jgi:isoleucyl-tRNA synthetase
MAPFTPFLTDYLWDVLAADGAPDSVHLAPWPEPEAALIDEELSAQMALVRRLVELGRAARAESGVRTRQPLGRALVGAAGWAAVPEELRAEVADELNVVSVAPLAQAEGLVDSTVKPNFRALGKRFGNRTPAVAAAVGAADPAVLAAALRETGSATVEVDGSTVELGADDVVVTETPRAGWSVATEAGETVALDLELTPELRRAGLLREVVRRVQEARKNAGLDVSDRIELWWTATDEETARALREGGATLADEVLAASRVEAEPEAPVSPHAEPDLGLTFWLRAVG